VKDVEEDVMAKFPSAKKVLYSMVTVSIHAGEALPMGLGLPYANDTDPYLDGVVNNDLPLAEGLTLRNLMASKEFTLVVAACKTDELAREMDEAILPPRFAYPYGEVHGWDLELYEKLRADTKAETMFIPANAFADLNSMLAVNTQAVVQDFLWVHQDVQRIANEHLAGYLVPHQDNTQCWVIIPLNADWVKNNNSAWRHLTRNAVFEVEFINNSSSTNEGGQVKRYVGRSNVFSVGTLLIFVECVGSSGILRVSKTWLSIIASASGILFWKPRRTSTPPPHHQRTGSGPRSSPIGRTLRQPSNRTSRASISFLSSSIAAFLTPRERSTR
jgi:hypothetical protein